MKDKQKNNHYFEIGPYFVTSKPVTHPRVNKKHYKLVRVEPKYGILINLLVDKSLCNY